MNNFREFFEKFNPHIDKKTGGIRKHRHMADIIPDVSSHTKTGGKTVPEYCKAKDVIAEFESLKQQRTGTKVINQQKASKLKQQFSLKTFSGKLGNTGISIQPHTKPGFYILQK